MNKTLKILRNVFITLPIIFIVFFLGYLPIKFDIVLYTDNVVGEGICQTYVCPQVSFSPFYQTGFYFGSKLKKATIQGYHYDVEDVLLTISDISDVDIIGFDVKVWGARIHHYDMAELTPSGNYGNLEVDVNEDNSSMHFHFFDPNVGTTIDLAPNFIPLWFWIIYFAVLLLLSFLLAIFVYYAFKRFPEIQLPITNVVAVLVCILAGCFFCGSLPYVEYTPFLLNWLLVLAVSLILDAVTLSFLGTILSMAFMTIWYIANYYVIRFRNKPIMPADLKAVGTAKEVMGGYDFNPGWRMILGIAVVILYAFIVVRTWKKLARKENLLKSALIQRGCKILVAGIIIFACINSSAFKSLNSFAWDAVLLQSFHKEGIVLTFLKSAMNSSVKKPEGYSREKVEDYLSEYLEENDSSIESDAVQPTRIIMVMNEAFSDLRTVGLNEEIDVMPNIDSLDENTVEGSLYVSVFGGGTCNTEFEALTGNTLAFMGIGAYPYTENVTHPLFSLASYFKELGYVPESFHANMAENWNRNQVYPNLGFDEFNSIEDYPELTYLHGNPADAADYQFIEDKDSENNESPRFSFCVTMQNHSGYERWEDVEKAESVDENGSDLYVDTQIYLSLIKASDEEVQQLIDTYKDDDTPTMIVFFGDHQPGLPAAAQADFYNVDNYIDLYKSKFFIWTNYETEMQHDVQISANYLPWLILERGNFKLPPFVQLLQEVHEKYPVISSMGVIDDEGNVYTGVAELEDDPLIQKYQYVQYANLFDEIDPAWFEVEVRESPETESEG